MNTEEIFDLWSKDSQIDRTELGDAALEIPKLHHKYFQILLKERLILKKYEAELKKMKLDKYEFYTQGPNEETIQKGWKLPPKGMILKGDIPMYLEADEDLINLSLKIGLQQEKVSFLEDIVRSINNRNYIIRNAIDWQKFTMGA